MGYKRAIFTGNYLEVWSYEKEVNVTPSRAPRLRKSRTVPVQRSYFSISQSRKTFTRLIQSNLHRTETVGFATFTFASTVGFAEGTKAFTTFVKSLRRDYNLSFEYVAVPEFQKRGSIHFHVLFFGLQKEIIENERVDRFLQNIWAYGYVDCLVTDRSPKIAHYMGKYLSKTMSDERTSGKKTYFSSRGLVRPVLYKTAEVVDFVTEGLDVDNVVDANAEYDTMYLGRCTYKKINLTKKLHV